MNQKEIADFCKQAKCEILFDEPMKKHTSFKIGGPADLFLRPSSEDSLLKILEYLKKK